MATPQWDTRLSSSPDSFRTRKCALSPDLEPALGSFRQKSIYWPHPVQSPRRNRPNSNATQISLLPNSAN
jgi:hypothetical protein